MEGKTRRLIPQFPRVITTEQIWELSQKKKMLISKHSVEEVPSESQIPTVSPSFDGAS